MTVDHPSQIAYVLKVADIAIKDTNLIRQIVAELPGPPRIVGELHACPAVIIESHFGVEQLIELLPSGQAFDVMELFRHYSIRLGEEDTLSTALADARASGRLAVGATAVERAIQRRRLELLVIATDIADDYKNLLQAIITRHAYRDAIAIPGLTKKELGQTVGVRRAGCVGLLKGGRRYVAL